MVMKYLNLAKEEIKLKHEAHFLTKQKMDDELFYRETEAYDVLDQIINLKFEDIEDTANDHTRMGKTASQTD